MTKVELASQFMEKICNDNSHGYSQVNRWGPDYDCSSLVITCYEESGVPVKTKGATYTGNMYGIFRSCGFQDVTSQVNLTSGSGMKRGDVLLNSANHTALYLGDGKVGHARSSEGNAQTGDQSGNEIRIQSYWNYPWDYILRFPDDQESTETVAMVSNTQSISSAVQMVGKYPLLTNRYLREKRDDTESLQTLLVLRGFSVGVDGYFGDETVSAVKSAQKQYGLLEDGECGPDTWYALITNS